MARTTTDSEALDHGLGAMEDIGTVSFPRAKPRGPEVMALNQVAFAKASYPADDGIKKVDIGQELLTLLRWYSRMSRHGATDPRCVARCNVGTVSLAQIRETIAVL